MIYPSPPFLYFAQKHLLQTAAWALSNICRAEKSPALSAALLPTISIVSSMLTRLAPAETIDAMRVLHFVMQGKECENYIQLAVDVGVLEKITCILQNTTSTTVRIAALNVLGNITSGSHSQTQVSWGYQKRGIV